MGDAVGELAEIRQELRKKRTWGDADPDLREEIGEWIQDSHDKGDADTAEEFVERELNQLLAENEMYDAPSLSRGADGFPDRCADCRHYGAACPVLKDQREVRWRERKLDQAETEREARQVYQQQAIDVECDVIPQLLSEWDNQHAEFIARGQELLARLEDAIMGLGDDTDDREQLASVDDLDDVAVGGEGE